MTFSWRQRILDELAQARAVAIKDVRVYYLKAPMVMFGLLLPFSACFLDQSPRAARRRWAAS